MNGHTKTLFLLLSLSFLTSCGKHNNQGTAPTSTSVDQVSSRAIVGEIDWKHITTLPAHDSARITARAVGYISIPSQNDNRCTAFLVAPDLVMTNWHCYPEASHAKDAHFYPEFTEGKLQNDYKKTPSYDCSELVITNEKYDFALLRCQGNPGNKYGILELETNRENININEPVYVIHQNCDYWNDFTCPPIKLYSPGKVMEAEPSANEEARAMDIFYDNDTLGGSSGSPVFSKRTNKVIAIHHNGHGKTPFSSGRGSSNSGVPLHLIVQYLKTYHPHIQLGNLRSPGAMNSLHSDTTDPVIVNSDFNFQVVTPALDSLYEPNNTLKEATYLSRPSLRRGSISSEQDLDVFKFYVYGQNPVRATLSSALSSQPMKDLDLFLVDQNGKVMAHATDLGGLKMIRKTLPTGIYYLAVVGNDGATGDYNLQVR